MTSETRPHMLRHLSQLDSFKTRDKKGERK
uniref:30S ribosomal protein S15 n=1 Tax=Heterorhabditis bacteriophora TaxID=37862 RepID=A0A1I7W7E4_HETBA